ncbi:hypothetical protein Y1Q_0009512 [Alligator mississippiensis]|uniref:Uncharacterized protein n=1 Tax=Alligator mississippiensis TaxID=8496 RepID=A0A151NUC9_ALLMI|nr:hypothetical protein Y1Q_0009512 [Alligator mississippiensis]
MDCQSQVLTQESKCFQCCRPAKTQILREAVVFAASVVSKDFKLKCGSGCNPANHVPAVTANRGQNFQPEDRIGLTDLMLQE